MIEIVLSAVLFLMGGIGYFDLSVSYPEPVRSVFVEIDVGNNKIEEIVSRVPNSWIFEYNQLEEENLRVLASDFEGKGEIFEGSVFRVYFRSSGITDIAVVHYEVFDSDNNPIELQVENGRVLSLLFGDFNCDGKVNIVDALLLLRWLATLVDTIPTCKG